jgi:hypothetical protein
MALRRQTSPDVLQRKIEDRILENPDLGDVVPGTGGLRKFRLADESRGKGSRGGFRIYFLDLPSIEKTYLLVLFDKDQKDDISSGEKKAIRILVQKLKGG